VARARDEFLATVSHELRAPLGCIKGYATTLLLPDGLQDEWITRRGLESIAEASDELQELVDELLDMIKIRAGTLDVNPAPVWLRPLALAAAERFRPQAVGHDVRVEVPTRLPAVYADAHRVEQVLSNLLDNAIKYSPEGGRIAIVAEADDAEVCVGVVDEGLGIPPVLLGNLFQRFHREATARTRSISGTGLGLAICKGIVEAHGGRIWAQSPVSGRQGAPRGPASRPGTVVRFTLPIAGSPGAGRFFGVDAAAPAAGPGGAGAPERTPEVPP
jgi:signal transduction histidine kinase